MPFSTGFDHTRIADEVNYKFQQCLAELTLRPDTAMLPQLPLYGLGHSLGALLQVVFDFKSRTVLNDISYSMCQLNRIDAIALSTAASHCSNIAFLPCKSLLVDVEIIADVVQLLMSTTYATPPRAGNAILSFNNKVSFPCDIQVTFGDRTVDVPRLMHITIGAFSHMQSNRYRCCRRPI